MNLLFDQNISFRIIGKISSQFPQAKQVRELGLEDSTDLTIWKFARDYNYAIVTFDADFYELSAYYGHPPKIIWLRTGNRNTEDLASLLVRKSDLIVEFLSNESYKDIACLEVE